MTKRVERPKTAPNACLPKSELYSATLLPDDDLLVLVRHIFLNVCGDNEALPEDASRQVKHLSGKILSVYQENEDKYLKKCDQNFKNRTGEDRDSGETEQPTNDRRTSDERPRNKNKSNQNNENQNKTNIECESDSNSSSHNLESSSYSYSQPKDGQDAQQPMPLPKSVKEVMDIANAKEWNVSESEAKEWFITNILENKGHDGKTGLPFVNWLGVFHNHLLKQRETTENNIWLERMQTFGSEEAAEKFGDDAELDSKYYEAAQQVLCLNLHSQNPKENQRLAALRHELSERCKLYDATY